MFIRAKTAVSSRNERLCPRRSDGNHKVSSLGVTDILQTVQHVGGREDDSARLNRFRNTIIQKLQLSFADKKDLRISMLVRRMGHLAWGQHRFINLSTFARDENAREDPSHRPPVRQIGDRKTVV